MALTTSIQVSLCEARLGILSDFISCVFIPGLRLLLSWWNICPQVALCGLDQTHDTSDFKLLSKDFLSPNPTSSQSVSKPGSIMLQREEVDYWEQQSSLPPAELSVSTLPNFLFVNTVIPSSHSDFRASQIPEIPSLP